MKKGEQTTTASKNNGNDTWTLDDETRKEFSFRSRTTSSFSTKSNKNTTVHTTTTSSTSATTMMRKKTRGEEGEQQEKLVPSPPRLLLVRGQEEEAAAKDHAGAGAVLPVPEEEEDDDEEERKPFLLHPETVDDVNNNSKEYEDASTNRGGEGEGGETNNNDINTNHTTTTSYSSFCCRCNDHFLHSISFLAGSNASTTPQTTAVVARPPRSFLIIFLVLIQMVLIIFCMSQVLSLGTSSINKSSLAPTNFSQSAASQQQPQQQQVVHEQENETVVPESPPQQKIQHHPSPPPPPHDHADPNDLSWLDHVHLGEWIGSGGWSDAFEAIIDKDYNPSNKSYIIKFTGDIEADGDVDHAKSSITAVEVIRRLSPHPSIPENLYFVPKIPNPFPDRYQLPNATRLVRHSTGAERMNRKRLTTSKFMSIQISERVIQTHNHMEGRMPGDKLRCFLYHFFQVLDYAHSKNVMMIDLVLYNVILQDGVMKFIDWSDAMIFETDRERKNRIKNNITYPYSFCSAGICSDGKTRKFEYVHEYDVQKLAYRIGRLLRYYEEKDMDYDAYVRKDDNEGYFISTRDMKLIKDLIGKMSNDRPAPRLRWLLDHHDYFTGILGEEEDGGIHSNCTLLW